MCNMRLAFFMSEGSRNKANMNPADTNFMDNVNQVTKA